MRQRHGLEVELAVAPSPPALSQDVRSVLFEAAREALFNVVKHAGTERVRLSLATGADGRVRLVVEDQGVGFDVSAQPGDGGGDGGFGLFSIRERLHLLGGAFEIRSCPGAGTRVEVTAPLGTAATPASDSMPGAAASAAQSVAAGAAGAAGAAALQASVRILLVDDHAMMRRALSSMLAGEPGLSISGEAADGLEAIAAVEQAQPDLVLMDLTMPRLDGLEATRRIKQRWPGVRVIGLSMHDEADRAKAMLDAGAAAYLCKNGDVTQLLETIHRVSTGDSAASPN
jgi:CheY-like chemotaxis protein